MDIKIKNILDEYLIPDLSNIVVNHLKCQKCKILNEGIIRCICGNYMCKCHPMDNCPCCKKIICHDCCTKSYCCNRDKDFCDYCNQYMGRFIKINHICLFDKCKTNMCKKCWNRFGGLCRGHKLLKIHKPHHKVFKGLLGT